MLRSRIAHSAALPLLVLLAVCAGRAHALAYIGNEFTYRQPDGTPFVVRLYGNDRVVRVETRDGWTLMRDADRWWCYATSAGDGIAPSALRVGAGDPSTLGEPRHLRLSAKQRAAMHAQSEARLGPDLRGRPAPRAGQGQGQAVLPAPPAGPTTGTKHGLTIMVQFSDHLTAGDPDAPTITRAQVIRFCNGGSGGIPAYTEFENACSVYQYYYDNSHGLLSYTNHVVDYITAPQPRAYYADTNPAVHHAAELVTDVLNLVPPADLQAADADGDKVLDAVNIFYAGTCPNEWGVGLWPHMNPTFTWSGSGYSAGPYQMSDMGTHLAIGTFCHENGHMLCGFPDLYDYDSDSSGSAGFFSLMAAGNYGGSYKGRPYAGTNPVMIDGYLATAAGWRTVTDVAASDPAVKITAIAGSTAITRFRRPGVATEYFLAENRQRSGHDADIPGAGLLIWHVDELGDRDDQRYAKNSLHHNFELALVQADNLFSFETTATADYYGDSTDPWYKGNPAAGYVNFFWDDTGAAGQNNARWWDGSASGLEIDQISASGPSMTYTIGHPTVGPTVTSLAVTEGNSGTRNAVISVTHNGISPASVQWSTADGTATVAGLDYRAASGSLSWGFDDHSIKRISIPILGDTAVEPDETFTVVFSNPVGASLGASTTTVTITNDDAAPAAGSLQFAAYAASVTEGAAATTTPVTVTVKRVGGSTGAVSVHWTTVPGTATAGSDFTADSDILSWGDADSSDRTITVQVTGDALPENDESFGIVLSDPTGGAITPAPNILTATIINDDSAVAFPAPNQVAIEPATGTTSALIVVQRTGAPHGAVTVDYATSPGTAQSPTDFIATSGTLSFPDGISFAAISVVVAANSIPADRRDFTLTLSNPTGGVLGSQTTTTVEITDAELLATGISPGSATNGGLAGKCGAGAAILLLAAISSLALRRRRG